MLDACSKVHVVVAPEYGEELWKLPPGEPAWVADTPANCLVIKRIWSSGSNTSRSKQLNITSFQVAPNQTSEERLLNILSAVEEHHGAHSQIPPYSTLHVVGAFLSPLLKAELESCGFARFENSSDGFIAYKLSD